MRDVIAAVEIVVDEHLPVAVEGVVAPLHPVQIAEAERVQLAPQVGPEELLQRRTAGVGPGEHPLLRRPRIHGHEAVRRAIEVADAGKVRRALERAVERRRSTRGTGTGTAARSRAESVTTAAA